MPAGIGCRGRIARASPMGKGRSIRPFPIKTSELVTTGLRCQVKIRGPARRCRSLTSYSHRLSGGQSCGGITFVAVPAFLWSRRLPHQNGRIKKAKTPSIVDCPSADVFVQILILAIKRCSDVCFLNSWDVVSSSKGSLRKRAVVIVTENVHLSADITSFIKHLERDTASAGYMNSVRRRLSTGQSARVT